MLWCYSWLGFEAACWGPPEWLSIRKAAAVFRERNRGSFFIWDYNRDSKGLPGIFKLRHGLGGWWCWLLTLLSVELQLHIYLQLLSDCFEHFLCKAEPLEHAVGMAVAGKGLWYSWEQCDPHKCPVTTAWNPLHRSSGLGPRSSILPAIKKNNSVWLRAETLPIPNVVWKFWAWVSPVPSGEHNYCQRVSAKQGPAQGSHPGGFSHGNLCWRHLGMALGWHHVRQSVTHGSVCLAILTPSNLECWWITTNFRKWDKAGIPRLLHWVAWSMIKRQFDPFFFSKGSG